MIKTYKYGLLAPIVNGDLVRSEIKKAHIYQNKLIEIERWRRDEFRKIEKDAPSLSSFEDAYAKAEIELSLIIKEQKSINSKARKKVNDESLSLKKKDAQKIFKKCKEDLRTARKSLKENVDIKTAKDKIYEEEKSKVRELRKNKDTPWYGTYMLIEDALQKTKKMPLYDGVDPNNPRFKSFNGEGRIGIQQVIGSKSPKIDDDGKQILNEGGKKMTTANKETLNKILEGSSKSIQIIDTYTLPLKNNGGKKKVGTKSIKILKLRIGSDEKKKPIFADFPMIYHRPIPTGSTISVIQVICNKIGPRERWTVSITIETPDVKIPITNNKAIAFDMGWREKENGVTIATYQTSDGKRGEIIVPNNCLDKLRKAKDIKSIRDLEFNKAKEKLSEFIKSQSISDWLKEKTEHLHLWKSSNRLVRLVKDWYNNRFDGDEDIFEYLGKPGNYKDKNNIVKGGWRYHDFHLWQWESSQRNKAINYRNEIYKQAVSKLSQEYEIAIFEDVKLNNLARGKVGSTNRQLTAPGLFRELSKDKFNKYTEVSARHTSMDCAQCKHRNEKTSALEFFCENCKIEIQRDENAAVNILNLGIP